MRKNTAKKISAFVSKLDTSSKLLIAKILDGKISKADAIKEIDGNISEIQKIYKAVKTLASTKTLFIKASKDDNFETAIAGITSIATRLDLVKQVAESLDDEEDYSDISSDDILKELGVEETFDDVVEQVNEDKDVEAEKVISTETESEMEDETESEMEDEDETESEMEETLEDIGSNDNESDDDVVTDETDVVFEGSKKNSASVKKIKKLVSKIKRNENAGVSGLFNFIK